MKFGKEGAEIRTLKQTGASNLGENFIVMWDADEVPIHIHKEIVEYLHKKIQEMDKKANDTATLEEVMNKSPFLEGAV